MATVDSQHLSLPFKVKAKYGWSGQAKGDLGFLEGDVMEVSKITGDWYYGRLLRNRKCVGYFPNNFVKLVEERLNETNTKLKKDNSRVSSSKKYNAKHHERISTMPPIPTRSTSPEIKSKYKNNNNNNHSSSPYIDHHMNRYKSSHKGSSAPDLSHYDQDLKNNIIYSQQYATANNNNNNNSRKSPKMSVNIPNNYNYIPSEKNSPLPTLPPIPTLSRNHPLNKPGPTKSYSANDIRASRLRDTEYYRDNQQFYDGYEPSGRNSEKNSDSDHSSASEGLFSNSKYMDNSLSSSDNSFAFMSDFSATSAGSFARHRFAKSFTDSLERSHNSYSSEQQQSASPSSSGGRMGGLLSKILPRSSTNATPGTPTSPNGDYPRLPDLRNLNISQTNNEARDWLTVKSQVNRSRTLTKYEKHPRYMRALEEHKDLVLHPQDAIYNGLNTNEVKGDINPGQIDIELLETHLEYIDKMTRRRCVKDGSMRIANWAHTTFSARYKNNLEKLRGIFIFCTEMFDLIDDNGGTNFTQEPPNLDHILHKRYCTPYELTWLFKKLANSFGITCEIVIGFLKTPTANNWEFKYNHCWLRVLINKEWRFVDVILGNVTNPIHEFIDNKKRIVADDNYFLAEPLHFIYTHIPPREYEQHIVPSVDPLSAMYLPLVFPSFFTNDIRLYKFSTALSFLEDSEVYECSIEVPSDIEVFSSVVTNTEDSAREAQYGKMELSLTQVKKNKADSGRRIVIIKAVLPPGVNEGMLYIHSGLRGTQTTRANIHPLSMIVPLFHRGEKSKFEFLIRKPCETVRRVETYIVEPQTKYLYTDNEYNFEIIQHPFDGIIYNETSVNNNRKQHMIVKSPSGKVFDLVKSDPHFPFGTWRTSVKVKEQGVWTAHVASDSGTGYSCFAEWHCV